MNGTNGAKLHKMVRELRGGDAAAQQRADQIERAWGDDDYSALVELGALTRGEVQVEKGTRFCANPECGREIKPRDSISAAFPATGEIYCVRCPPGRLRIVRGGCHG